MPLCITEDRHSEKWTKQKYIKIIELYTPGNCKAEEPQNVMDNGTATISRQK